MGKDKGLIIYHGKPQREYLFELLSRYCHSVYTSCYAGQVVPEHLNPLIDEYDLHSPINGILTSLKKNPGKAWLVVAVDMPNVNDQVLQLLVNNRDQHKVATCFYNAETKLPEPLLTIWETSSLPLLMKFVAAGKVSPRDFLTTHPVRLVDTPDNKILFNVNSPDQWPDTGH
jgi:molybdenum cofactor guanylyltransferase